MSKDSKQARSLLGRLDVEGRTKNRNDSQFTSAADIIGRAKQRPAAANKKKPQTISIVPRETKDADKLPPPSPVAFENRQLSLFQKFLANTDEERDTLSNVMDLWDSVPRYSISRQKMTETRINGQFLQKHERSFQHRSETYTRTVAPARVTDKDGVDRDYYPSASEELVEDALRKIATEQQAGYFDKPNYRSGVTFTLHMLRAELSRRGHTRSFQEIIQSLNILSGSIIEIRPKAAGVDVIKAPYFPVLAAVSKSKRKEDPKSRWLVQFHPLVTGAIDDITYRQYNYALMMGHSSQLARWAHKYLVMRYTFAEFMRPFEIRYSTISRESGLLDGYTRSRKAVEMVDEAIEELKERGVFLGYKRVEVLGPRKKVIDVIYTVTPNIDLVREVKAANSRQRDAAKTVGIGGGSA